MTRARFLSKFTFDSYTFERKLSSVSLALSSTRAIPCHTIGLQCVNRCARICGPYTDRKCTRGTYGPCSRVYSA